ncbi:excinuclease ABC subunit UvrA [Candidatus Uhrbacteria bacterium]|nr:excinuclease ABC subunit UvrA [Candidatus Uhrbacteria bacterium]
MNKLVIKGARVHNLKNISVEIPKEKLVVITDNSGSGKSSLAFDTIYAEGQRRFMESLSSYARQFLELQDKPDVDHIDGLSPTIAIDQRSASANPRSTVGTVTEIYDYLRVLFARAGKPHCPSCGVVLAAQSPRTIAETIRGLLEKSDLVILAPVVRDEKGEHRHTLEAAVGAGFGEVRFDGTIMEVDEALHLKKDKTKRHSVDVVVGRLASDGFDGEDRIPEFVKKALDLGNGELEVRPLGLGEARILSERFACPKCKISIPPLEPRLFSFNSPHGSCQACTGLGTKLDFEVSLVIPNKRLTFAQGAVKPWTRIAGNQNTILTILEVVGKKHGFSVHDPVSKLNAKQLALAFYGTGDETYEIGGKSVTFSGIIPNLEEKYRTTDSEYVQHELENYMRARTCPVCNGKRLRAEVLGVTVQGRSIADVVSLPIDEVQAFFAGLLRGKGTRRVHRANHVTEDGEGRVIELVAQEVELRLRNLVDVGLAYLTLDRSSVSLSGGEAQRVRLATQLGATLTGVIYILDEPSIGLHQRDNAQLITTLKRLRDLGNTVIVVEHDEQMIRGADWVVDVGPGAGVYGGEIVAEGTPAEIARGHSLTGLYLSRKKQVPVPKSFRKGNGRAITVKGARAFNLKNIDAKIPLGRFVCVTGVSGSGKSTLVLEILGNALAHHFYRAKELPGPHKAITGLEYIDKVVTVDQSAIGRTPRSNPATYTGVFAAIRDLFTETPEAKLRGFDAGKFSFNVKGGGRCEACSGEGYVTLAMQFLPDVYVLCRECRGTRYNAESLEVRYRGKHIADILDMTVEEAGKFFHDIPAIAEKLDVLKEVGLGYIRLGQPAPTLSGGEAQRVKLATELSRRATGRTLYILDEPTTGLHFDDVGRLLAVLHQLVDKGNTVLIIEHNLDVIKGADWVIELGPEGGLRGGEIVAEGTPTDVARVRTSPTGQYLVKMLAKTKTALRSGS